MICTGTCLLYQWDLLTFYVSISRSNTVINALNVKKSMIKHDKRSKPWVTAPRYTLCHWLQPCKPGKKTILWHFQLNYSHMSTTFPRSSLPPAPSPTAVGMGEFPDLWEEGKRVVWLVRQELSPDSRCNLTWHPSLAGQALVITLITDTPRPLSLAVLTKRC